MGSSAVTKIGGSGGGGSKITVSQTNSFSAGDVVRYDSATSSYVKALATTAQFAEAIGIIETATTTNFVLVLGGKIDTSQFSVVNEDGTTETVAGDVYFLSAVTEGKLTQTAPTASGTIRKAMLTQTTADGIGYVTNYIGIQNGIGSTDLVDISEIQPVGTVSPFAGGVDDVPNGFLLCDGSQFAESDYPELAAMLGEKYGAISGNLYTLPDLRGRFALGNNPTGDGGSSTYTRRAEGDDGGEEVVVLTTNELPAHSHDASYRLFKDDQAPDQAGGGGAIYGDAASWVNAGRPQIYDIIGNSSSVVSDMGGDLAALDPPQADATIANINGSAPVATNDWTTHGNVKSDLDYLLVDQPVDVQNAGSNSPHNNIPPFLSVNFIIKASASASAAILTTGIKNLSDVDTSRGGTAGTDNVRNGDILLYNSSLTSFVAQPYQSENFLRNGDCRFWQRGTSFFDTVTQYTGIPNSQYTADGFFYRRTGGTAFKVIRGSENAVVPLSIATAGMDFVPARRNFSSDGTGDATETIEVQRTFLVPFDPIGSEQHTLELQVEGYDFARLVSCDYMTLSFYAYTTAPEFNVGGRTIGVSFRNKSNGRSYVTSFVPSVGAWAKYTISVPLADIFTSSDIGNWSFDHTVGLSISFALGAGTELRVPSGSENQWVTGNFLATQTQYNLTNVTNSTNTTSLGLALLKLEAGAYATRFTAEPWEIAMQRNRRHFQKSYELYEVPGTVSNQDFGVVVDDPVVAPTIHVGIQFPVQMRGTPTMRIYNPRTGNADEIRSFHGAGSPLNKSVVSSRSTSTTIEYINVSPDFETDDRRRCSFHYTADAELLNPSSSSANLT